MTSETLKRLGEFANNISFNRARSPQLKELLAAYRAERRFSGRLMWKCDDNCIDDTGSLACRPIGKKCNRRNCPVRKEVVK